MKIKVDCPICNDILEVELDSEFKVISVKSLELESTGILSEENKKLINKLGIEFG